MKTLINVLLCGATFLILTSFTADTNEQMTLQPFSPQISSDQFQPFSALIDFCGEDIYFEGYFHERFTVTIAANGSFHGKFHINAKGTGVGLSSGATYQWNDSINESFNGNVGETYTFNQSWKIIGQGQAPNFKLNDHFHVTINANGDVTAVVSDFSAECK